jgi:hypothetical protein
MLGVITYLPTWLKLDSYLTARNEDGNILGSMNCQSLQALASDWEVVLSSIQ